MEAAEKEATEVEWSRIKRYSSKRRSSFISNDNLAGLADDCTELDKIPLVRPSFLDLSETSFFSLPRFDVKNINMHLHVCVPH